MKRCWFALLFKNPPFFDLIIIPQAPCTVAPYTISRSSQMDGMVFGCRIIIISIEGNDSSTASVRYIPNIQVAHTLIGGTSCPWYSVKKRSTINDILDMSARFTLLFLHGVPEVIDKYLLICGCNGRDDDLNTVAG